MNLCMICKQLLDIESYKDTRDACVCVYTYMYYVYYYMIITLIEHEDQFVAGVGF